MTLVVLSIVFSLIVMSLSDRINTIIFLYSIKNQMHKLLKQIAEPLQPQKVHEKVMVKL